MLAHAWGRLLHVAAAPFVRGKALEYMSIQPTDFDAVGALLAIAVRAYRARGSGIFAFSTRNVTLYQQRTSQANAHATKVIGQNDK
jgi:hypothetical protein